MSDAAAHPQLVQRARLLDAALRAPGAFYLIAVMGVFLTLWTPGFFTAANLTNIALQVAVLTIVALGMTLIILTEGLDLSLGPVLGLCGVVASLVIVSGYPLPLAVGAALAIGTCFGLLNGILIAVAGLPAFIVTLGSSASRKASQWCSRRVTRSLTFRLIFAGSTMASSLVFPCPSGRQSPLSR
jgi:ribose transport system permease protein